MYEYARVGSVQCEYRVPAPEDTKPLSVCKCPRPQVANTMAIQRARLEAGIRAH